MEPNETGVKPNKSEQEMQRMVKAEQLMREVREKFPHESKAFGIEGIPESYVVILKTPISKDSVATGLSGGAINIKTDKHIILSPTGIHVLTFKNFPGHNPDISEEIFQESISSNSLQDPMDHNPENSSPISPYYTPDGENERLTLFNKSNVSVTVPLGKDIYSYVSLRNLRDDDELKEFIENAQMAEKEMTQSEVGKDIENIDKMHGLLEQI